MGFVIGQIKTVKRKVEFELPASVGEKKKKADFIVELHLRDKKFWRERKASAMDELVALQEKARAQSADGHQAKVLAEFELAAEDLVGFERFIREDVAGLEGLLAPDGTELPFSAELLEAVLADQDASRALAAVWADLNRVDAQQDAKQKN